MNKNIHRKKDGDRHTDNHGERFVLSDELKQGFCGDLFMDLFVALSMGTVPTMMTMG